MSGAHCTLRDVCFCSRTFSIATIYTPPNRIYSSRGELLFHSLNRLHCACVFTLYGYPHRARARNIPRARSRFADAASRGTHHHTRALCIFGECDDGCAKHTLYVSANIQCDFVIYGVSIMFTFDYIHVVPQWKPNFQGVFLKLQSHIS